MGISESSTERCRYRSKTRRSLRCFGRISAFPRRRESGLSVVIPYPDPDIDVAGIVRSVIHHYFFPILSGDLVVEVQGNGVSETLDAQTLPTFVERSELVIGTTLVAC